MMDSRNAFDGFTSDVGDEHATRWGSRLSRFALVVMVLGLALTAVLWTVVSAEVGALTLSGVLAAIAGVFTIRQAIIAERR